MFYTNYFMLNVKYLFYLKIHFVWVHFKLSQKLILTFSNLE
jgi:hypothetical protein